MKTDMTAAVQAQTVANDGTSAGVGAGTDFDSLLLFATLAAGSVFLVVMLLSLAGAQRATHKKKSGQDGGDIGVHGHASGGSGKASGKDADADGDGGGDGGGD
jgi:hypothetical protein